GGSGGGFTITALLAFSVLSGHTRTTVNGDFAGASTITIQSIADNTATASSLLVSVSVAGLGGAVATAEITSAADIETIIGSTAVLSASGRVVIEAKTRNSDNRAIADAKGGSFGGVLSGSIMVATAKVNGAVRVQLDGDVTTTSGATTPGTPAIGVTADGTNYAQAQILVINVGFGFSGSASIADAEIQSGADVEITGASSSDLSANGLIEITATSNNHAKTKTQLGAGGLLAVGVAVPTAVVDGATEIDIDGNVNDASAVTVSATSDNFAEAESKALSIGAIGAAITAAEATVGSGAKTDAKVGQFASYSAPGGAVQVYATSTNHADASVAGVTAGVVAVSLMSAIATVSGETVATFDGTIPTTGTKTNSLLVQARGENQATVSDDVFNLSIAGAVTALEAKATVGSAAKTSAVLGSNASVDLSGPVTLDAGLTTANGHKNWADAEVTSAAGGLGISLGAAETSAKMGGAVEAQLNGTIEGSSTVTITAISDDYANANTEFASIGGLAGLSATATTATITTGANTIAGGTGSAYANGAVTVTATSNNHANATSDSASGGLIGGSLALPEAKIEGSTKAAFIGSVTHGTSYTATATSTNNALADAALLTIGAMAIAGAQADALVTGNASTEAGVGSASIGTGVVTLTATSNDHATVDAGGATGGGVAISVLLPNARAQGSTRAFVNGGGTVNAGTLNATATATPVAISRAHIINLGLGTFFDATPEATAGGTTEVYIGFNATVNLGSGAITMTATRNATATTTSSDVSVSVIGVSLVSLSSTTNGTIAAHIDDRADVTAGSVALTATGTSTPTATMSAVGIKVAGGAGSVTTATDNTTVAAFIGPDDTASASNFGDPTSVTTTGTGVTVNASLTSHPLATSSMLGISLAFSLAIVSDTTTATPTIKAY